MYLSKSDIPGKKAPAPGVPPNSKQTPSKKDIALMATQPKAPARSLFYVGLLKTVVKQILLLKYAQLLQFSKLSFIEQIVHHP